jgi:hypothetical protein
MVFRSIPAFLVVLAGLAAAAPAEAQSSRLEYMWHSVLRDFQRNNCWPDAFIGADRLSARAPFALMVNNGWRRQNMLAEHHFAEGTATLNAAGELKIRWTMTQAPLHHRTIYVRRALSPQQTAERVDVVRQFAAQFADANQPPVVLETNLDASGWPATRVDAIDRRWIETIPNPRLPAAESGGETSQ